jgi:rare lipoprotein A
MSTLDPLKARRRAAHYALLFLLAFLSGCALLGGQRKEPLPQAGEAPQAMEAPQAVKAATPELAKPEQALRAGQSRKPNKTGKPYQVCGKTYHPLLTAYGYQEKGIASWYGPSFHGRHTSCGEVFDMYKPSAAHKLLPMRTKIRVTNLENGKSLTLTVNDRGPFVPGRVLDLSYAAAKRLAMVDKGLARILIRTSGPVEGQKARDLRGEFFVHVGSFEVETDALTLLEDMKSLRYKASTLKVVKADRDGETRWRVEVGPFKSMSDADKAESRVVKDYPSAFVVAKE